METIDSGKIWKVTGKPCYVEVDSRSEEARQFISRTYTCAAEYTNDRPISKPSGACRRCENMTDDLVFLLRYRRKNPLERLFRSYYHALCKPCWSKEYTMRTDAQERRTINFRHTETNGCVHRVTNWVFIESLEKTPPPEELPNNIKSVFYGGNIVGATFGEIHLGGNYQ